MLQLEQLGDRITPASIGVTNGVLNIVCGDLGATVFVSQSPTGGAVHVAGTLGDGSIFSQDFSGVSAINFTGGNGSDGYFNTTSVSDTASGGAGNDTLMGGTGASSNLSGGDGNDIVWHRAQSGSADGGNDVDYVIFNNTLVVA